MALTSFGFTLPCHPLNIRTLNSEQSKNKDTKKKADC